MITSTSHSIPPHATSRLETALGLARLVVKAHGTLAPAEIARELLATLLTGAEAACGALVLTRSGAGAWRGAPRVLAAQGVDAELVQTLLAALDQPLDERATVLARRWVRIIVPLSEPTTQEDGAWHRAYTMAHVLVAWDEADEADERRVYGQSSLNALTSGIAAVVLSLLATERRLELERVAQHNASEHLHAELLGAVSHELRSPLAAIKGYASTLLRHERRLPREERHAFLTAIDGASDRLATIINRLLEISQLETGDAMLDRFAMDLVPVIRDAIAEVRTRASVQAQPPATITLEVLDAAGLPAEGAPLILADQRAVREVVDNLLENAVKYSPQGGEIAIMLRPAHSSAAARGGEYLELVVSDQGVGIPEEQLSRIFERFHRLDTRLTREVDGLGLGLAICRRVVEMHGGAIWVESQPGVGSAFHVVLPIAA